MAGCPSLFLRLPANPLHLQPASLPVGQFLSVPHRTTWTEWSQSLAGLSGVVLRGVFVEMVYLGEQQPIAPRFRRSHQVIYTIITKTVQSRSLSVASHFDIKPQNPIRVLSSESWCGFSLRVTPVFIEQMHMSTNTKPSDISQWAFLLLSHLEKVLLCKGS
jgi:hypothetical protein